MRKKNLQSTQKITIPSQNRESFSIKLNQKTNDAEKALRLSVAVRLLRLLPKTPINKVIMAALKDHKSVNGELLAIVGLKYDY